MSNVALTELQVGSYTRKQQLFFSYIFFVLIDLTVINLFNQFWDFVFIESFMISLLAAILLQVLLKLTIVLEHRAASYFKGKPGWKPKVYRGVSAWGILFVSKILSLELINLSFGETVVFSGPFEGLVSFITVVTAILVTETIFVRTYRSLG